MYHDNHSVPGGVNLKTSNSETMMSFDVLNTRDGALDDDEPFVIVLVQIQLSDSPRIELLFQRSGQNS
jgi:hypothetical protein